MTIRKLSSDNTKQTALVSSLTNGDAYVYAHLIKFERANTLSNENFERRERSVNDYVYITDNPYELEYDSVTYLPNSLLSVGTTNEAIKAKASTMKITLDGAYLGVHFQSLKTTVAYNSGNTTGTVTITSPGDSWAESGFSVNDIISLTYTESTTKTVDIRITAISDNGLQISFEADSASILGTAGSSKVFSNVTMSSEHLTSLLTSKLAGYVNYLNRDVTIYSAHINPETRQIIGEPYILFKGIVTNGSVDENVSNSKITWTLTSHWGDFLQVSGRLTDDASHRGLTAGGLSDTTVITRDDYSEDLGFLHANSAFNIAVKYDTIEKSYKQVDINGGWFGGKRLREVETIREQTSVLDFHTQAKHIPVVYGVRKIKPIPVFVDTDDSTSALVYKAEVFCEGEIAGVLDILLDETPTICIDKIDFDIRNTSGTGYDADAVEISCNGNKARGDVLEKTIGDEMETVTIKAGVKRVGKSYRNVYKDIQVPTGFPNQSGATNGVEASSSATGVQHSEYIHWREGTELDGQFQLGKPNQTASELLIQGTENGYKIGNHYFDGTKWDYWGGHHRLLDTAYAALKFKLPLGESQVPRLNYIVKGKLIDCHNYDDSYGPSKNRVDDNNNVITTYTHTATQAYRFEPGDVVDIMNGSSVLHQNVVITERFLEYEPHFKANVYRFKFEGNPISSSTPDQFQIRRSDGSGGYYTYHMELNKKTQFVGTVREKLGCRLEEDQNEHIITGGFSTYRPTSIVLGWKYSTSTNVEHYWKERSLGNGQYRHTLYYAGEEVYNNIGLQGEDEYTSNGITYHRGTQRYNSGGGELRFDIRKENTMGSGSTTRDYGKATALDATVITGDDADLRFFIKRSVNNKPEEVVSVESSLIPITSTTHVELAGNSLQYTQPKITFQGLFQEQYTRLKTFSTWHHVEVTNAIAISSSGASGADDFYKGSTVSYQTTASTGYQWTVTRKVEKYDGTNKIVYFDRPVPTYQLPQAGDNVSISKAVDVRPSTNPALQLLDYMTSERYGKGLSLEDEIDLDSFLTAAKLCDERSTVSVVVAKTVGNALSAGEKFEFPAVNRTNSSSSTQPLIWRGTIDSISNTVVTGDSSTEYKVVTFKDCIGQLIQRAGQGREATNHMFYYNGEYYVRSSDVYNFQVETLPTMATSGPVLGQVGSNNSISLEHTFSSGNGNPIIKNFDPVNLDFRYSGYSLYDASEVKYWKYVGWNDRQQRNCTRHQMNQVIDTAQPLFDNIIQMAQQFNGILTYTAGKYALRIAGRKTAVDNLEQIGEEDIIGGIRLNDGGLKQSKNFMSATIIDPHNNFEGRTVSFFDSSYLKQDKGIPKKGSSRLPGVTNYFNARMQVEQMLRKSRYGLKIQFTIGPKGRLLTAGSIIEITYSPFNFDSKNFRITSLQFKVNGETTVTAEEHSDEIYTITEPSSDDRIDPSAGSNKNYPDTPTISGAAQVGAERAGEITLAFAQQAGVTKSTTVTEIWRSNVNSLNNEVSAGSFVPGHEYRITELGTTDFTLIGAALNTVGEVFFCNDSGSGSGKATNTILVSTQKDGLFKESVYSGIGASNATYYYWFRNITDQPAFNIAGSAYRKIPSNFWPNASVSGYSGTQGFAATAKATRVGLTRIDASVKVFTYEKDGTGIESGTPATSTLTATMLSRAHSDSTLAYVWKKDGTTINGETSQTLTYTPPNNISDLPEKITCEVTETFTSFTETYTDSEVFTGTKVGQTGNRGAGEYYVPVSSLPTNNATADAAWDASWTNRPGDAIPKDMAYFFTGTETNATAVVLFIYDGTNWYKVEQNQDGSIIIDNTVGNDQLGDNSVQNDQIADNAVQNDQIADNAVQNDQIADNAVQNDQIATDAVNADSLASDSVNANSILAETITSTELSAGSVTTNKIAANNVTADHITANSIVSTLMTAEKIQTGHLAAGSVTTNTLAANAITADKITSNSIVSTLINAQSIESNHIAANSITSDKITANSIVSTLINAQTIESNHIAANAITADKITSNSIVSSLISASTITSDHIGANAITTNELAANSITSAQITANSVISGMINASLINANFIEANAVNATLIESNAVNANILAANAVTANAISANSVDASAINVTNVAAVSADLGDITAGTLKANVSNPIADADNAPTGSENGAFIDLNYGKFVFGDANKYIIWDGTDLTISGVSLNSVLIDEDSQIDAIAGIIMQEDGTQESAASQAINISTGLNLAVTTETNSEGEDVNTSAITVDTTTIATKTYVDTQVSGIVDSAPAALDTLNELAAALGDDANFATTTSNALGNRVQTSSAQALATSNALSIENSIVTLTKGDGTNESVTVPNTTYDLTVPESTTKIRLAGSNATNDDVELVGGTNVGVVRTNATTLTINGPSNEAIRDLAAGMITAGSNITVVNDDAANTVTITGTPNTQRTDEEIRDVAAALITGATHTNISVSHDDANDTLAITGTPNTQRTDEDIRDVTVAMLTAGTGITLTENDANDTLTVTNSVTARTDEEIRDVSAAMITGGSNITVTKDDNADTVTIAGTPNTQRSDEDIRDVTVSMLTAGTGITLTEDDGADTLTVATTVTPRTDEEIRDVAASIITAGTNVTVAKDDDANTVTISSALRTDEEIRDVSAAMLTAGDNITVTKSDAADTVTIAGTPNTQRSDEDIRDVVVAMLSGGNNITLTEDDSADTLTIDSSFNNTQRTDEDIRDVTVAMLTAGTNVTLTEDDANDTLTITTQDTTFTAGTGLDLTNTQFSIDSTVLTTTGAQTVSGVKTHSANIELNNTKALVLKHAGTGTNSELSKIGGDATRFSYYDNSFIFDAKDNNSLQVRNADDSTIFSVNPVANTSIANSRVTLNQGSLNIANGDVIINATTRINNAGDMSARDLYQLRADGFLETHGDIKHRKAIQVLNSAGNGWVTWLDRNSGTPNIQNINDITMTGTLKGPASFTIDPATHGDNTGTVVIAGNLQVDGTTTTINSTTLDVDDLNITVASGAADAAAANGAGLTVDGANATFTYTNTDDSWNMNRDLRVLTTQGTGTFMVGRTANQSLDLHVTDTVNSITAIQDSDGNGDHYFRLNRDFDGSGANEFAIQKDGTNQLSIDTSANATFAGNAYFPQGTTSAPSIAFTGRTDTGLSATANGDNDNLNVLVDGTRIAYFNNAGITSNGNVYTGYTSAFRNYGGTWKATTGLTGYGFEFANSVDGTAMTVSSTGNVNTTGDLTVAGGNVYITDTNTDLSQGGATGQLKITTPTGWVSVGSENSSWAHIQTDRGSFYFNKTVVSGSGTLSSYNQDLTLSRASSASNKLTLGTETFKGHIATNRLLQMGGFVLDTSSENVSDGVYIPGVSYNNIAGANKRLTVTSTKNGTSIDLGGSPFQSGANSGQTSTSNTDTVVITISDCGLTHGSHAGIQFGGESWRAKDVKIETSTDGSTFTERLNITNSGLMNHHVYFSSGGTNTSHVRYTLTNFAGTAVRINHLWAYNYNTNRSYWPDRFRANAIYGDFDFKDTYKATFGNSEDLQIYHDASNSVIKDNGTGKLILATDVFALRNVAMDEDMITASQNGAVTLLYDNGAKLATTSGGVSVTGNIVVSGTVDGRDIATDGTKLDTIDTNANNYTLPAATSGALGGIKIGYTQTDKNYPVQLDSEKAYVNVPWSDNNTEYTAGALLDLSTTQFNVDLTELTETTDDMESTDLFVVLDAGNQKKVQAGNVPLTAFDSTGFTATADGGNASQLDGQNATYYLNTSTSFSGAVSGVYNSLTLGTQSDIVMTGTLKGPQNFTIDPADANGDHGNNNGTLVIAGNLQVDGTSTTINSTTLDVDDLNITVAKGAADSAAANGSGITVDGADASLTYEHASTGWLFNRNLRIDRDSPYLTLKDTSDNDDHRIILLDNNGADVAWIDTQNDDFNIRGYGSSRDVVVYANDTRRMTVKGDTGRVGIGTDSPSARLHVKGETSDSDDAKIAFRVEDSSGSDLLRIRDAGEVIIPDNYLFVSSSQGAYFTGSIRARGNITNDGGNELSISSGNSNINFNTKNLYNVKSLNIGGRKITKANTSKSFSVGNNNWSDLLDTGAGTVAYSATHKGLSIDHTSAVTGTVNVKMPIDPEATYRLKVRVKQISTDSGSGKFYAGVKTLDEDFANLATDNANSYNYALAENVSLTAGQTYTFEGTVKGYNVPTTGGDDSKFDPEGKYFDFVLVTNHQGSGETVIQAIDIQKTDDVASVGSSLSVGDLDVTTATTAVSSTSATVVDSFAKASFRSAKYTVQITQGTNYQVSEVLVLHNGTTASATEFAKIETNGVLGTLQTAINGNNVELKVTMSSASAATVKVARHCVTV